MQKLNDAIIVQGGPISQLNFKSNKPTSLKGWSNVKSKGCFFVEENKDLVGHTYQLELPFASNVYCEVQASALVGTPDSWTSTVDVGMIVFRKSGEKDDLVFMTEWVDGQKSFWSGDLRSGSYLIVPYTSGCRLTPRVHNDEDLPLTRTDYNDQIQLTKPFCETLLDIFELCDLDGNGRLSREEFNWFHIRTTDEEVDDDAWKVVLENVDTTDGEMTRKGFEQLHLMQAQEAESSP
uniref:EF-hand domain-containing protein n=1 Tax=Ciona savignyi TaxID=51511 RepID=H2YTB7_CIOSA